MNKTAYFRFEASAQIGAGHAMRCSVLADCLVGKGWSCIIVTSRQTYDFTTFLNRFDRIDPERLYDNPIDCALLVVDCYDLDCSYEKHFRQFAKKILVIDDLANRRHDCDILLDQTYGRKVDDYENLVPAHCKILTGCEYALLRREFAEMRIKALEKRKNTTQIERILISLGGSDLKGYTIKALQIIQASGFLGKIDIALGFQALHLKTVQKYTETLSNECIIHVNADMPKLIYDADLAIGAAGSSVWERCCLGLPSILIKTADNQSFCFTKISKICATLSFEKNAFYKSLKSIETDYQTFVSMLINIVDGQGAQRVLSYIQEIH